MYITDKYIKWWYYNIGGWIMEQILKENEEKPSADKNIYESLDEWAKKEKGYDSYSEWYLDNMD